MRFLVDELPYYEDSCPFEEVCGVSWSDCPKYWGKDFINSEDNPHCCDYLCEKNEIVKGIKDKYNEN